MALQFYNTLTRKKEDFKTEKENEVRLYTCGPTVYNHVHIGNLRAMLSYDLVNRYLKYKGYKVSHIMNITDVDDKTIRDSKANNQSLKEFTEFYTKTFFDDLKTLNMDFADIIPKATEEIDVMVDMIKILLKKDFAYKNEAGDIYFKIAKMKDYGTLALLDPENLKANATGRLNQADEYEKEDARDFALWKAWTEDDGDVFWDTEIGKGRPGWHTECAAMSYKYAGLPLDIHMGGVDLVFPHHTNEIAEAEAAYGEKFCNFWIHNEHLLVNGQKMSKSLGNFYTLNDLLEKGYRPEAIRYELMATHYRAKLDFREDNLKHIPNTLNKFYDFLDKLKLVNAKIEQKEEVKSAIEKAKKDFESEMDNDLNISGGLAAIFTLMNEINKVENMGKADAEAVEEIMQKFDTVLGVMKKPKIEVPEEIKELAEKRIKARAEKNWDEADKLRDEITAKGFIVEDTIEGYKIKKK